MTGGDGLDAARFLLAQQDTFETALAELRRGRKESHWMWFIFPQLRGLGRSERARYFGLDGLSDAQAFLAHDVLGPRLVACAEALMPHADQGAEAVLGAVDAIKLRSSATLFAAVEGADPVFARILDSFFEGQACPLTRAALTA